MKRNELLYQKDGAFSSFGVENNFIKMTKEETLEKVRQIIIKQFSGEGTGHDYFHIERVVNNALRIGQKENVDLFLVELSAWLHDVGDYKLNDGIDKSTEQITIILSKLNIKKDILDKVIEIVSQVSFSKGQKAESMEAKVVQDADRLDAIGAIGIARTFAFGGSKQRELYNPVQPDNTSVQHFYNKLFLLKEKMNTTIGKEMAKERHNYMKDFLDHFYKEWKCEITYNV